LSPEITAATSTMVIEFSYSMYGSTMGTLEIAIKRPGSNNFNNIFTKSGDQGQAWKTQEVNLGVSKGEKFRIQITAIRGTSYQSDIAIDDVIFKDDVSGMAKTTGQQVVKTTRAPVVQTTRQPVVKTTRAPVVKTTRAPVVQTTRQPVVKTTRTPVVQTGKPPVGSTNEINFEPNFGGWTNDKSEKGKWILNSGKTRSSGTGPNSGAHGSEYYMYFETSYPMNKGDKAVFQSPVSTASSTSTCLNFCYSMYGRQMGSLEVSIKKQGSSSFSKIFTKSGDQDKSWKHQNINLAVPNGETYQVKVTAIRGSGHLSDIAIDNIKLGPCV